RIYTADKFYGRIFFKHNHKIDGFQCGEHFSASDFILDRTGRPLQAAGRCVAVEADDQAVASGARSGEYFQMTGVYEIETAIGEADALTCAAPFVEALIHDFQVARDFFVVCAECAWHENRAHLDEIDSGGASFANND